MIMSAALEGMKASRTALHCSASEVYSNQFKNLPTELGISYSLAILVNFEGDCTLVIK
jgi:hypothetical protein